MYSRKHPDFELPPPAAVSRLARALRNITDRSFHEGLLAEAIAERFQEAEWAYAAALLNPDQHSTRYLMSFASSDLDHEIERMAVAHDPWRALHEALSSFGAYSLVVTNVGITAPAGSLLPFPLYLSGGESGHLQCVANISPIEFEPVDLARRHRVQKELQGLRSFSDPRWVSRLKSLGLNVIHDFEADMDSTEETPFSCLTPSFLAQELRDTLKTRMAIALPLSKAQECLAALLGAKDWQHLIVHRDAPIGLYPPVAVIRRDADGVVQHTAIHASYADALGAFASQVREVLRAGGRQDEVYLFNEDEYVGCEIEFTGTDANGEIFSLDLEPLEVLEEFASHGQLISELKSAGDLPAFLRRHSEITQSRKRASVQADAMPRLNFLLPDVISQLTQRERKRDCLITSEAVTYRGGKKGKAQGFVRCVLELPVQGYEGSWGYGVWVNLSDTDYERYLLATTSKEVEDFNEVPMRGRLANLVNNEAKDAEVLLDFSNLNERPRVRLVDSSLGLAKAQAEGLPRSVVDFLIEKSELERPSNMVLEEEEEDSQEDEEADEWIEIQFGLPVAVAEAHRAGRRCDVDDNGIWHIQGDSKRCFVSAKIFVPITTADATGVLNVWVELSTANYKQLCDAKHLETYVVAKLASSVPGFEDELGTELEVSGDPHHHLHVSFREASHLASLCDEGTSEEDFDTIERAVELSNRYLTFAYHKGRWIFLPEVSAGDVIYIECEVCSTLFGYELPKGRGELRRSPCPVCSKQPHGVYGLGGTLLTMTSVLAKKLGAPHVPEQLCPECSKEQGKDVYHEVDSISAEGKLLLA